MLHSTLDTKVHSIVRSFGDLLRSSRSAYAIKVWYTSSYISLLS